MLGGGHGTQTYVVTSNTITDTKFDGIRVNADFGPRPADVDHRSDHHGQHRRRKRSTPCARQQRRRDHPAGRRRRRRRQPRRCRPRALISNNTITGFKSNQIHVQGSDGSTNASDVQATITNNSGTIFAGGFGAGLLIDVGDGSGVAKNVVCANISGNDLNGSNTTAFFDFDITLQLNEAPGAGDAKLRIVQASTAALSTANSAATVERVRVQPAWPDEPDRLRRGCVHLAVT